MLSSLTAINLLIRTFESTASEFYKKERIETPDWAKETPISQTTDCEISNKAQDVFPFEACMSVDNFTEFVSKNSDMIQKKGSDFIKNLHDKRRMNLLHCACVNDCAQLINILITKYHIHINDVDIDGYSPLFYSVNQWSEQCVKQLLSFKPRLDLLTKDCVIHATGFPIYICGGKTILHQAAETNAIQCCKLIVDYIAQFHSNQIMNILFKKDLNGFTAMDTARMHNKPEMLQLFNSFIRNHIECDQNRNTLKLLQDDIDKKEATKLKRKYHLKTRQRIKQNKAKLQKEQQINISTHYKPKFSQLFFRKDIEYFPLYLLDKTLLKFIHELRNCSDLEMKLKIVDKYSSEPIHFLQNPLKGIYIFPVFSKDLCEKLLLESENYMQQALSYNNSGLLPITRPNSMNSYGLVLNTIGMRESWNYFVSQIIKPLSDVLIPANMYKISKFETAQAEKVNEWKFKSHHTFIIRYKEGEDIHLDTHIDASAVTLNICLGKQGFEGANVYFHAIENSTEDMEKDNENYEQPHSENNCKFCRYELVHKIGFGALHVGNFIHGTKVLTKGTRSNVVIWCKEYHK